jgi:hypothetical protein
MPAALLLFLLCTLLLHSSVQAQTSGVEFQAGLGYARVFDGGGLSFAAVVEQPLSADPTRTVQHALGGSIWYSDMSVGSAPNSSLDRHMLGLGVRYELELRACCGRARAYFAVPLQLMQSSIPDVPHLEAAGDLQLSRVPELGPPTPVEDKVGADWGWGTGLETGFRVNVSQRLRAHTSVQGLYQRIYEAGTRHWGWSWHAGLSYALQGS